ncbi:MAG TPA: EamA family transporter [Thermoanaerobaculia bacterium]|nr:EamA family transporter [Thermoanaerobaculia bacterium]
MTSPLTSGCADCPEGAVSLPRPAPPVVAAGPPPRWKLLSAFATVYVVWGSTYLAIRFAIETLPPFLMAAGRFLVAGGLMWLWAKRRGAGRPTRRQVGAAAVVGLLLLAGGNGGVVWAEQRIDSGLAALLVATVPLWVVGIEWLLPGGRRPRLPMMLGVAGGLAGIALLVGPAELAGAERVDLRGAGVLVAASLLWTIGSLYASRAELPASARLGTAIEMLVGGAGLVLAGALAGDFGRLELGTVSALSWAALAYLVVFGSLIAFSAYVWLLRVAAPTTVATYAYVNPVVALLLGWAFAGEELSARTFLAAKAQPRRSATTGLT